MEESDINRIEQEVTFDLYTALDALGAEDRSFIILKYFEGYSYKDISTFFQMPESTVKSEVYRCLESLLLANMIRSGSETAIRKNA